MFLDIIPPGLSQQSLVINCKMAYNKERWHFIKEHIGFASFTVTQWLPYLAKPTATPANL